MVVQAIDPVRSFALAPEEDEETEYRVAEARWRIPGAPGAPTRPSAGWTEVIRRLRQEQETRLPG